MGRSRFAYAGWVVVVIAVGLASRSSRAAFLPAFVTDYAGDTLWALMVFLGLGLVFSNARTGVLAGAALGIAFAVEFSQLWEVDWLNQIRATRAGALGENNGSMRTVPVNQSAEPWMEGWEPARLISMP